MKKYKHPSNLPIKITSHRHKNENTNKNKKEKKHIIRKDLGDLKVDESGHSIHIRKIILVRKKASVVMNTSPSKNPTDLEEEMLKSILAAFDAGEYVIPMFLPACIFFYKYF